MKRSTTFTITGSALLLAAIAIFGGAANISTRQASDKAGEKVGVVARGETKLGGEASAGEKPQNSGETTENYTTDGSYNGAVEYTVEDYTVEDAGKDGADALDGVGKVEKPETDEPTATENITPKQPTGGKPSGAGKPSKDKAAEPALEVVDNGYVDIYGKRIKGTGDLSIDNVYAKCGELENWKAKLWIEYNNGAILYETVNFNRIGQGGVISTDTFGLPFKYEIVVQAGGWEFDSIMCAITNNYSYPRS